MSRNYKSQFMRLCFVLPMVFLGACGDDDVEPIVSEGDKIVIETGIFLDSAVEGINYQTETQSGQTSATGAFSYVEGETVTFSVGSIVLPSALAKEFVTPMDLANSSISDPVVLNIAQFLQTLDADANAEESITIPASAHAEATGITLNFSDDDFDSSAELTNFIANAGGGFTTLVSEADAFAHLETTQVVLDGVDFTNDFLSGNTFSVVNNLDAIQELYFSEIVNEADAHTGSIKYSDKETDITSWVIDEEGNLDFTEETDSGFIDWKFTPISMTNNNLMSYEYIQPDVINAGWPGTGNMTIIENAFIPGFLIDNTFSVNHTVQTNLITSVSFQNDGVGTFVGTGGVTTDMTWSITLGLLKVKEAGVSANPFEWVFTAQNEPDSETSYSYSVENLSEEYNSNGFGTLVLIEP